MTRVVALVAVYLLNILSFMMLFRAIASWLPIRQDNKLVWLLHLITEPIIAPVRALLYKLFQGARYLPIDISFMVTYLLIIFVQSLLQSMI